MGEVVAVLGSCGWRQCFRLARGAAHLRLRLATCLAFVAMGGGCAPPERETEVAAGALRVGGVLGDVADSADYSRAALATVLQFPVDHGPHPRFRSEWWYFTAALESSTGTRYGAQFTVFRQALAPYSDPGNPWQTNQIYLGHVALTDVSTGVHRGQERFARGHPELAGASHEPFAAWVDGWSLRSTSEELFPMRLDARADEFELDLELGRGDFEEPVLQGRGGYSAKGQGNASHYYSLPRIPVTGSLVSGGQQITVQGLGWIDREWSTSVLSPDVSGWDWFGLHLDSGVDLMLFRLRRFDGTRDPFDSGAWIAADGRAEVLDTRSFELRPGRLWRDERGRDWPVEWTLSCQQCPSRLRITAEVDDQLMDTSLRYWEGLVAVYDAENEMIGRGYMELTGY